MRGFIRQLLYITQFAAHGASPNSKTLHGLRSCVQLLCETIDNLVVLTEFVSNCAKNLPNLAEGLSLCVRACQMQ